MLVQAVAAAMISMATDRIVRRLARADRKCRWHLEVRLVRRPEEPVGEGEVVGVDPKVLASVHSISEKLSNAGH